MCRILYDDVTSQAGYRHPAHAKVIDSGYFDVTGTIYKRSKVKFW
jgi:hypothetical protein